MSYLLPNGQTRIVAAMTNGSRTEGFAFVGIERSPQPDRPVDADNPNYIDIAAGRLAHVACVAPPARVDGEPRAPAAQLSIFDLESPCT